MAVVPETVAGRLFMSTTNGTRALDRVREVPLLVTAARTVQRWLRGFWRSGRFGGDCGQRLGRFVLPGGFLGSRGPPALLKERDPAAAVIANDELSAAIALWHHWRHDREACLRTATMVSA